jgi:acetoacetyl-CoA synthetase
MDGRVLWTPSSEFIESSNLRHYCGWLKEVYGLQFPSYEDLRQWSVSQLDDFWRSIWEYYAVISHSPYTDVLVKPASGMIGTQWFAGSTLNYSEHVFRNRQADHPAVIFQSEANALREISWTELERRTASLAASLAGFGVGKGDRVAAFLPNIPEAIIAFLAVNSLGAIWSGCSPDFGAASVTERFRQIDPKVIIVADGYRYNGKAYSKEDAIKDICSSLPSLERVIYLPYLDKDSRPSYLENAVLWEDTQQFSNATLQFTPVEFDHPLWVLYSSGTTGKPKAITHSNGGNLLEHLKALGLHQDCRPGDRFFWYSTTGWMMWNYALASLLHGSTVCLYDGAAGFPDLHALWDFARNAGIQHFGAGASFYIACMKDGLDFIRDKPLPELRSVGSTGSPLPPEAFQWIYSHVKEDAWLISLSGGTDVCSGFVGGNPFDPVYKGEIQCRMLGCDLQSWDENGVPVIDEVGEMVLAQPMPSMPVYFWGDAGNRRYASSYFDMYPGIWRHGDWIRITPRGTLIIYGRSDATLNRGGVRIGTSEVYSAVEGLEEITDSLVVCIEREDGSQYMPLFVVVAEGSILHDDLKKKINTALRNQFSPRHVPDAIFGIGEIPYTISGKKMETPVKKILSGMDITGSISRDAMKNPDSLDVFFSMRES